MRVFWENTDRKASAKSFVWTQCTTPWLVPAVSYFLLEGSFCSIPHFKRERKREHNIF